MADHSLFVFVRVQGATPETVGNALKDGSDKILDIYSIMGEWDLLVRIEHPDLNEIQRVVAEARAERRTFSGVMSYWSNLKISQSRLLCASSSSYWIGRMRGMSISSCL